MDNLECGHYFHTSCMLHWHNSINNQHCPFCRNKIFLDFDNGLKLHDKTCVNQTEKKMIKAEYTNINYEDTNVTNVLYLELYEYRLSFIKSDITDLYDTDCYKLIDILTCNYKLIKEQLSKISPSLIIKYYNLNFKKYKLRCLYRINIGNTIDTKEYYMFNRQIGARVKPFIYKNSNKNGYIYITSILRSLLMFNNIENLPVTINSYYDGEDLIEYFDIHCDTNKYKNESKSKSKDDMIIATDYKNKLTLTLLSYIDIEPIIINYFINNGHIDKLLNTNILPIIYDLLMKHVLEKPYNYLIDKYLMNVFSKIITLFDILSIKYDESNLENIFEYYNSIESVKNFKDYINNNYLKNIIDNEKKDLIDKKNKSLMSINDEKINVNKYNYDIIINI